MNFKKIIQNCKINLCFNALYLILNIIVFSFLSLFMGSGIFLIMFLVYFLLFGLMNMRAYENYICFVSGARPLKTKKEKAYLEPLFDEVSGHISKVKLRLYIVNDFSINAFAIGTRTIAITKGAINGLSEEQLKGLIAHEVGHIYYAHTMGEALATFGNGIFSLIKIFSKLLIWLMSGLGNNSVNNKKRSHPITIFFNAAKSRKNEHEADHYAMRIGYGNKLLSVLYMLDDIIPDGYIDLKQHTVRTHPYLYDRIAMLERWADIN